jgi:S-DNA-T family DNA segregation ATPase FtsK/SpoIIIE
LTNLHFSPDEETPKIRHEILGLSIFFLSVFQILGFLSYDPNDLSYYQSPPTDPPNNNAGIFGAWLTFVFIFTYGLGLVVSPLFLFSLSIRLFRGLNFWQFMTWFFYFQMSLISLSIILATAQPESLGFYVKSFQISSSGGEVGTVFGLEICSKFFGNLGNYFLFSILFFISTQGILNFSYFNFFKHVYLACKWGLIQTYKACMRAFLFLKKIVPWISERGIPWLKNHSWNKSKIQPAFFLKMPLREPEPAALLPIQEPQAQEPEALPELISDSPNIEETVLPTRLRKKAYQWSFPTLDLLREPTPDHLNLSENIEANGHRLVHTLQQFDVESQIVGIESGPVITRYEIQIASGIKVQKVTSLDNDIALAMRAKSVRIIAPIPGKAAIGIEIPNQIRKMVFFKELLLSKEFQKRQHQIPLILGKDIGGKAIIADLATMPHLLIAGATGSGKSVCVNTIIMSILYTLSPKEIKLMMVDPKKVEMATYKNLAHLFVPLITNPNKVAMGLRCLIDEMERRYQLFKDIGVRNIASYNQKDKSEFRQRITQNDGDMDPMQLVPDKLPYIVVIIDELADLMMVARNEVESGIVRIAQLSRAVGIHLILATQRPSVDVVTGLIKANVPARIAFRVASKVDSRTVLDANGADKLLGHGDMLFLNPGDTELGRIQGAYLSDEEINATVEYWKKQGDPEFDSTAMEVMSHSESENGNSLDENDPLFDEAINAILDSKQASTSFLQRRFRIGYNRASRLIDDLAAKGIIGPPTGSGKNREIYLENQTEKN